MPESDGPADSPPAAGEDGAYRLLFEHNPLPMWVYDRETLRFLSVNEAAVAIYGFSRAEFDSMTILDIRPPEDRAAVRDDLARGIQGYDAPREWRHLHADGSVRTVEISAHDVEFEGRPGRLVLSHDVTERKRAEEERRRSYRQLERLTERLATLHAIDRSILAAEDPREIAGAAVRRVAGLVEGCRTARLVGLAAEPDGREIGTAETPETAPLDPAGLAAGRPHVIPDTTADPSDPRLAALARAGVASVAQVPLRVGGRTIAFLDLHAERPDAFDVEAIEMASEVADQIAVAAEQSRLRRALELHAAELERRVAERTHALVETNADLEAFAYSVSHDLRSPLRTMSGFAHALLEDHGPALGEDGRQMAGRIVAAARRMDAIIGDLLAYGRVSRQEMEVERVSLDSIVASALSQIEGELREAEIEVDPNLGAAAGHYATLVQVVGNLASNAVKFAPPDRRPRVRIRAVRGNGEVTLRVEDNGIGIAAEHRERIFRVFERLHERDRFPGTGVGLAIVRRGVERMGGRVEVESVPGEGSVFLVTLAAAVD